MTPPSADTTLTDQPATDRDPGSEVTGFAMRPAGTSTETADLALDAIDPVEAMRAAYLGPDWVGPALIAVLFVAAVAALVILSGGAHWQIG